MRIAIGCDHRGFEVKQEILRLLSELGHSYHDFGCYDGTTVDYPDIARAVGEALAEGGFGRGILLCSTGIGMCIAANKVRGIRAALCHDAFSAERARLHNDANVLCLAGGGRSLQDTSDTVQAFLSTEFESGRHVARIRKIEDMETEPRPYQDD